MNAWALQDAEVGEPGRQHLLHAPWGALPQPAAQAGGRTAAGQRLPSQPGGLPASRPA